MVISEMPPPEDDQAPRYPPNLPPPDGDQAPRSPPKVFVIPSTPVGDTVGDRLRQAAGLVLNTERPDPISRLRRTANLPPNRQGLDSRQQAGLRPLSRLRQNPRVSTRLGKSLSTRRRTRTRNTSPNDRTKPLPKSDQKADPPTKASSAGRSGQKADQPTEATGVTGSSNGGTVRGTTKTGQKAKGTPKRLDPMAASPTATIYDASNQAALDQGRPAVRGRNNKLRREVMAVAQEVMKQTPVVIQKVDGASNNSTLYNAPGHLNRDLCPSYVLPQGDPSGQGGTLGTRIKIIKGDAFDVAMELDRQNGHQGKLTMVLNLANQFQAGGGFLSGALAQEETLCYRSTLYATLYPNYYPMGEVAAVYSPTIVVFREPVSRGYKVMKALTTDPNSLPVVAVISIAAIDRPRLTNTNPPKYKNAADRELMKEKMRNVLRIAGLNGHRKLVLGALGCGAFSNPPVEVAKCWLEVFREDEFTGGWWESVVFAITGDTNSGAFAGVLEDEIV